MKLTVIHIILFVATVFTTFFSGYLQGGSIESGIHFSLSIMFILGSHEFGHYFYARKYGVLVSPPYFIPVPPPFIAGTMGAFIKIKSQITSNRALFDIGVAGPLFGIVASLPVLIIGLKLSEVVPLIEFENDSVSFVKLGSSLIFELFVRVVFGNGGIKDGYEIMLHPVAFAGWIGLFITALNLIPSGQLDGGHLVFSLFSKKVHLLVSRISIVLLIILGLGTKPFVYLLEAMGMDGGGINSSYIFQGWPGWLIWALALKLIGTRHPPSIYEEKEIGFNRKLLAFLSLLILIGCFIPVPLAIN